MTAAPTTSAAAPMTIFLRVSFMEGFVGKTAGEPVRSPQSRVRSGFVNGRS
jgi:hypothetical protein